MSDTDEIVNLLKSEDPDLNIVNKLNEALASATLLLNPDSQLPNKLVLSSDGKNIQAHFEPTSKLASRRIDTILGSNLGELAGRGEGPSTHTGSGTFESKLSVQGLHGTYKLAVGSTTARLYDGSEQVWIGTGTQDGLAGEYQVKFAAFFK